MKEEVITLHRTPHAELQAEFFCGGHQEFSLSGSGGSGRPSSSDNFFRKSTLARLRRSVELS
jgi:hypothetical protein